MASWDLNLASIGCVHLVYRDAARTEALLLNLYGLSSDTFPKLEFPDLDALQERARGAIQLHLPSNAPYRILGLSSLKSGDFEEAAQSFHKSIDISPGDRFSLFWLGMAYEKQGRIDEAIETWRAANAGDAFLARGEFYRRQGAMEKADESYQLALRVYTDSAGQAPNIAITYSRLAGILDATGRLDEAAVAYPRAIDLDASQADYHASLGLLYDKMQKPGRAIQQLEQAVQMRPDLAQLLGMVGAKLSLCRARRTSRSRVQTGRQNARPRG
jgi:tetratricopeptide (TPR) repeat protein